MQINPAIAAALEQVAWRYHADLQRLQTAIEHESGAELGAVLGRAFGPDYQHDGRPVGGLSGRHSRGGRGQE